MHVSVADEVVGPLRQARQPLHDGLRQLRVAADAVDGADHRVALASLEGAVAYLRGRFLPAAHAEEFTLFIAIDGILGRPGSGEIMAAQHRSIAAMAGDLEQVAAAARTDGDVAAYARYLLPLLHGLYALIRAHLEAEDEVYLGLIDSHLSESQVGVVVENLRRMVEAAAG